MKKGSKCTEETKIKMSESKKGNQNAKGSKRSLEFRRKQSESMKGKFCGKDNPMFGKTHTQEAKKKISETNKGSKNYFFGRKHSEESRNKNRLAHLGKKHSEEAKRKISLANSNERNSAWKGDEAKYNALHEWVRKHKPKPKLCEDCKKVPPLHLSNNDHKYKRDIDDFEWLCRKCHTKKDMRFKK